MELAALRLDQVRDGQGGEGIVSRIIAPAKWNAYCIKQLSRATPVTWQKLEYQIEHPPSSLETYKFLLAWPLQIVMSRGKPCGFIMRSAYEPHVKLSDLTRQRIDADKGVAFKKFDREDKYGFSNRAKMCVNICAALESLYAVGEYNILDLKPDNILITAKGDVTLVDLDSIQIRRNGRIIYAGSGGTPGYKPPECALGAPVDSYKDSSWDNFALGVILYQVLIGAHPFSGTFSPPYDKSLDISSKIADCLFVYGEKANLVRIRPPIHDTFAKLPPPIQSLFRRALGKDRPQRPSPVEWGPALTTLVVQLDRGMVNVPPIAKPKPRRPTAPSPPPASTVSVRASHARGAVAQPAPGSAIATSPPPMPIPIRAIIGWGVAILIAGSMLNQLRSCGTNRPRPNPPPVTTSGYSMQYFSSPQSYMIASSPGVMRVNVRSGPGGGYSQVAQLSVGDRVTGIGFTTGTDGTTWIAVTLPGGASGFIAERLLSPAAAEPPSGEQPSFSCAGNLGYVERTICGDANLAAKDREVADLYQRVLRVAPASGARDTQRGWLEARDRCGGSGDIPACLHSEYDRRLAALRGWLSASTSAQSSPQNSPTGSSSQEPLDVWQPDRRQSGRATQQEYVAPRPTITCILPSGQEAQLSSDQCRQSSGVIYRNDQN